jgi:hypothetical protein
MAYVRKLHRGDRVYYERVESYRDEKGRSRTRVLEYLGANPEPPPEPITLKGSDFAMLAVKLMDETLAPKDVFDLLEQIGKKPANLDALEAIGIRFDLAGKKLELCLLPKGHEWKVAPQRAPRAKAASGGKGRKRAAESSPSKAKPK